LDFLRNLFRENVVPKKTKIATDQRIGIPFSAEFYLAQRQRKKVEALFAELKNQIGLRRLRLRRMKFVREQFFLAAAAQNIKRLVRFLSQSPTPAQAVAA
jgi:hypothetical protein